MPPTGNEIQLRLIRAEKGDRDVVFHFLAFSNPPNKDWEDGILYLINAVFKEEKDFRWRIIQTHSCKWPSFVSVKFYICIVEVTDSHWTMRGSNLWLPLSLCLSLPVSQTHINTYQFDIRLSVQRCLTDPLLSPDTASDCNCRERHT